MKQVVKKGFRTWWRGEHDGEPSYPPEARRYELFISRRGAGEFIPIVGAIYINQDTGRLIANKPHPHSGRAYARRGTKEAARFEAFGHIVVIDHGKAGVLEAIEPSKALTSFVRMRLFHMVRSEDPDPRGTHVFTEHCVQCGYEITEVERQGTGYCSDRCRKWKPMRRGR